MKRAGLICLMVLMLLASCTQGGRPSESGNGATTDVPSGGGAAGTEPRGTETGQVPEPELNGSGWCAVGSAGGGKAVILADTGAVVSLNYTGNVKPVRLNSLLPPRFRRLPTATAEEMISRYGTWARIRPRHRSITAHSIPCLTILRCSCGTETTNGGSATVNRHLPPTG